MSHISFQLTVAQIGFLCPQAYDTTLLFDTFEARDRTAIDAETFTAADSQSTSLFTENLVLHTGLTIRFGGN